jgi:hypothetical protein
VTEDLVTLSGHTLRKELRCARQGTIKGCRLVQWDDDPALYDGFRYAFYDAAEACPQHLVANDDPRNPDPWDRLGHLIGEVREVAKGDDELKKDGKPDAKVEWAYVNRDNGGSQTNRRQRIYVELSDLGPADRDKVKSYRLFLDIEPKTD